MRGWGIGVLGEKFVVYVVVVWIKCSIVFVCVCFMGFIILVYGVIYWVSLFCVWGVLWYWYGGFR